MEKVEDTLVQTVIKIGTLGVYQFASSQLPFLKLPIIRQISEFIIETVLGIAVKETEFGIFILKTKIDVSIQGKEFRDTAEKYHASTGEERTRLEKELIDHARNLIKL